MIYFTKDFIAFFEELSENNHKDWFDDNRKRYQETVKKPFESFVNEMILRLQENEPDMQLTAKEAIFRINRDIRFSKDKAPYKTHAGAGISKGGRKSPYLGYYLELGPKRIMVGGGIYFLDKEGLQKVRSEIAHATDEFTALVEDKDFKKRFGEVKGERNKVLPAEYKEVVQQQPLIANKHYYYMATLEPKHITNAKLPNMLMEYYQVGRPLNSFFKKAMS
jgi:uncharacterized protein (TIGR02453 family)